MPVGRAAHPLELRGRPQQRAQRIGQRAAVAEGEQPSATIAQKLLGVPVGRRDHRRAGAHGVGQGAAGDLGLVLVRADEDVRGLQVAAQLGRGDELIAEHDVLAHPQSFRLPLQRRAIGLAVPAGHHRMGGADDEIGQLGKGGDDGGQGPDHCLDPLVGAQQAEGEEHVLPGHAEFALRACWSRGVPSRGCRGE